MNISDTMTSADQQIARLRSQVEALMNDRVTPLVSNAAGRAESAMHTATDSVRNSADAVSGRVRKQPLIALAVSAGIGFLLGRIIR
jgi:ElaB/YqjD/DUF883 family membrane-anchored ribosome-binding protein